MLKHQDIWRAIDKLAEKYGYSASGLARAAGLDATTFNLSKRMTPDGKKRWPFTESIAKILEATGAEFIEFVGFMSKAAANDSAPKAAKKGTKKIVAAKKAPAKKPAAKIVKKKKR